MPQSRSIRKATVADASACRAIYAPYVTDTAVTFEVDVPTETEMARRIETALQRHTWLVLESEGSDEVLGYAYAGTYRPRAAYRFACETSVYLAQGAGGTGAGRFLYQRLLDTLTDLGFVTAVAGMTLPNPASVGLHQGLGFTSIGTFQRVGYKFGGWHDVAWMQRGLAAPESVGAQP